MADLLAKERSPSSVRTGTDADGKPKTGAVALAEMAQAYGVRAVFFVPTFALKALAELNKRGIRTISAHGEKAAAYMADGYARATWKPGICMAQAVGSALVAAGLKEAYMAHSPVIAITGGPESSSRGRRVYQQVDDFSAYKPVTKWATQVDKVERMPELLRQAFRTATTGAPGPVHLEFSGALGYLVEEEGLLDSSVDKAFGATPAFRPVADGATIGAAVDALSSANAPVIVAGQGVMSSGAESELLELAEKLDVPVVTSLNAKAALPDSHPLSVGVTGFYSRSCANKTVAAADLVFFVGTTANSMTTTNWTLPKAGTRIIQLDIAGEQIGRHFPTEVGLLGDAKATLRGIIDAAKTRKNPQWTKKVTDLVSEWREEVRPMRESQAQPIRPERICAEIGKALPDDGAVVVDTLQASIWAGSMIELSGPSQRFVRCAGSLGWGLPASIGVKAALGDRPVVCFTGDGGLYYHLGELETAARYGLNVVVVVNNNGAYAGEEEYWAPAFGAQASDSHWKFGDINFAKIAEAMGCVGVRITDPAEIGPTLKKAFASKRPVLLDVITDFSAYHPKGWRPS
jgi:acetolactate synthase-1/2/3 large subunit